MVSKINKLFQFKNMAASKKLRRTSNREEIGSDESQLTIYENKSLRSAIRYIRNNNSSVINVSDVHLFRGVVNVNDQRVYKYDNVQNYMDIAFPLITKDSVERSSEILTEWYKVTSNEIYYTKRIMDLLIEYWNRARKL